MIDLHCHSVFSDGFLTPAELLQKALHANIKVLALTDHDTVAGLEPLHAAAQNYPIQIINGIELSVQWKKHDIHILGLKIDPSHSKLLALIEMQRKSRILRAQQISERLSALGISDAYHKASDIAGHENVARPHFAQVIINENKSRNMHSAFKQFLGRGKKAYVPTPWASIETAVQAITQCGGHAIIAHPLKYQLTRSKLTELIDTFKEAGGTGLEVVSGGMTALQVKEMAALCERHQLLASTGSDFHGDTISMTKLGQQPKLPLNCTPVWHQWNLCL